MKNISGIDSSVKIMCDICHVVNYFEIILPNYWIHTEEELWRQNINAFVARVTELNGF